MELYLKVSSLALAMMESLLSRWKSKAPTLFGVPPEASATAGTAGS